jgi:enoyl-CoA hydratase/carnithine racemase
MMVQLADVPLQGVRVVLLRGAGGSFCSGGNLTAVQAHLLADGAGAALTAFMSAALDRLADGPAMVVAAVEGAALGGGAELLTACDAVYASPDARIAFVQASLGVSPGFGGGTRLVERVGARRALAALTDGEADCGLVDARVADPVAAARAHATRLLALPPASLLGARRLVLAARRLPHAEARAEERAIFAELWGGPAHRVALSGRSSR